MDFRFSFLIFVFFSVFSLKAVDRKKVGEIVESNQDVVQARRGGPNSLQGLSFYINENGRYVVQLPDGPGSVYEDEDGNVFAHDGVYEYLPGNAAPESTP